MIAIACLYAFEANMAFLSSESPSLFIKLSNCRHAGKCCGANIDEGEAAASCKSKIRHRQTNEEGMRDLCQCGVGDERNLNQGMARSVDSMLRKVGGNLSPIVKKGHILQVRRNNRLETAERKKREDTRP